MREPETCNIKYCGYKTPRSPDEINFEILGLENLIKKAKERISALKQSSFLANRAIDDNHENLKTYFEKE
tara:strand:- start:1247 stop:1456 length:210 start_codon:yes stop_codon:yes gene_type:complete